MEPKKINEKSVSIVMPLIQSEYDAFYHYRSLSNWCKGVGFELAAEFFMKEAEDELTHAKALESFLVDWNITVSLPTLESPKSEYKDLVDGIDTSYDMEYNLYNDYNKAVMQAMNTDVSLFIILQERAKVQYQAVVEYSDKMNMLQDVDTSKTNLLILENKLF
jgi:ferritin